MTTQPKIQFAQGSQRRVAIHLSCRSRETSINIPNNNEVRRQENSLEKEPICFTSRNIKQRKLQGSSLNVPQTLQFSTSSLGPMKFNNRNLNNSRWTDKENVRYDELLKKSRRPSNVSQISEVSFKEIGSVGKCISSRTTCGTKKNLSDSLEESLILKVVASASTKKKQAKLSQLQKMREELNQMNERICKIGSLQNNFDILLETNIQLQKNYNELAEKKRIISIQNTIKKSHRTRSNFQGFSCGKQTGLVQICQQTIQKVQMVGRKTEFEPKETSSSLDLAKFQVRKEIRRDFQSRESDYTNQIFMKMLKIDSVSNLKHQSLTNQQKTPTTLAPATEKNEQQMFCSQFQRKTSYIYGLGIPTESQIMIAPMNRPQPFLKELRKQNFQIGRKVGSGHFGEVFLVRDKISNFICAMKIISKQRIRQQKFEDQITRQLKIQLYIEHQNISPLYGFFEDQNNLYLLVEFMSDGCLVNRLKRNHRIQEDQASDVILQICKGLEYIHDQDIIHRDIKPENVLFSNGVAKVTDFGWSVYKGAGMRKTASGSPLYYSPEIVMGNCYDQKIDVWDIGIMTYQCLVGVMPFRIYSEKDLNKIVSQPVQFPNYIDLSENAKKFILMALEKDPQKRMTITQALESAFLNGRKKVDSFSKLRSEIHNLLLS